ncbi:MAG: NADH-quinone oxidoreductase subunit L [Gemmataceae bacterium]|nr:NADH-quinone oxidoreductase subunit L [Gemmataceae bacterium]MDW8264047.1 NADH-quinone oxidoreductase subunit L [Gemmataceae bacterium]
MFDVGAKPGLWFVWATLLPLGSFVLLLLAGGVRAAARASKNRGGYGAVFFDLLGGDQPGKTSAYVALAAIALAFACSLVGSLTYLSDHHHVQELQDEIATLQERIPEAKGDERARLKAQVDEKRHQFEEFEHQLHERWSGRYDWAYLWSWEHLQPGGPEKNPAPGTLLQLGYRIDNLTITMFLMVTFIASFIHLFSIGYMSEELDREVADHQVHTAHGHLHRRGRFGRFFMFLSLFCFSMLNLVLADNLFQVFVSWELVGICSYLLIGFYYERSSATNAANKAFITNRVGDAGFIIGLLILWTYVGTFNFEEIFARIRAPLSDGHNPEYKLAGQVVRVQPKGEPQDGRQTFVWTPDGSGSHVALFPVTDHLHGIGDQEEQVTEITVGENKASSWGVMPYWLLVAAGLGVFLGCVGKSAQFPLHVWLPDAMEGPTPVSALILAATMVAAGVYLVGRVFPLFTPESRLVIAYTGGITLFVAATIAIVMTDIKKVLAYSTVSQLGYMMLALGVGGWAAGLFHLVTHAFFKALLFLGSGSVIHGCHHEQEMTRMGGLYSKMKITAWTMLIGCLAIAGTPMLSGWYSKDAIIAQALGFAVVYPQHSLLFVLPLVTAGITTFYMFRMWFLTFTGEPRDRQVYELAHESPWTMTLPLVVLAVFTVMVGWGWPIWDAHESVLEKHIHHGQHYSVHAEIGHVGVFEGKIVDPMWHGVKKPEHENIRLKVLENHGWAGLLALGAAGLGAIFALSVYYFRTLDPAEAAEQFGGLHRFLAHKWYFDEWYSAVLVRPALTVANWCRAFDTRVIDGVVDSLGRATVAVARGHGRFDNGFIDGLVNLTGNAIFATGTALRRVQTGFLRSYILFLALAAVGLFAALSYFVSLVNAG